VEDVVICLRNRIRLDHGSAHLRTYDYSSDDRPDPDYSSQIHPALGFEDRRTLWTPEPRHEERDRGNDQTTDNYGRGCPGHAREGENERQETDGSNAEGRRDEECKYSPHTDSQRRRQARKQK
jgi:hypothetical protein